MILFHFTTSSNLILVQDIVRIEFNPYFKFTILPFGKLRCKCMWSFSTSFYTKIKRRDKKLKINISKFRVEKTPNLKDTLYEKC